MAKRNRGGATTSTKKTSVNGRRVSKRTKIDKTEITDSIEKNKFLDYRIQQKYNLTEVHDNFLEVCFRDNCKMSLIDGPACGICKNIFISLHRLTITPDTKDRRDSIHPQHCRVSVKKHGIITGGS